MTDLTNPVPVWLDGLGQLADGAKIYIGVAGSDPELPANQLALSFPGPVAATQPIRTLGGYTVNGGSRTSVQLPGGTTAYSITVRDAADVLVFYIANVPVFGAGYQAADADLTAIAALTTTAFGRNLLTLPDAAALDTATGRPASLPAAGGTVSGNINRAGAGAYLYSHTGAKGKIYILPTSDTTTDTSDALLVFRT